MPADPPIGEQNDLSAEFRLIALCCHTAIDVLTCGRQPDPLIVSSVGKLASEFVHPETAADRIVALCRKHQTGPMTYRGLVAMFRPAPCSPAVTTQAGVLDRLMSGLESHYLANVLQNEWRKTRLSTILEWFAAAGIRAVPFKGPIMAWQLYGDIALRPSSDLDFILHEEDLLSARELLESKGFRTLNTMTAAEDAIWRRSGRGYDMGSPDGAFTVDIATGATPDYLPYNLRAEEFWNETREIEFNGRSLKVMSPELQLIFLCWHGTKHMWEKLIWVADLHAVILQGLDWAVVQRLAGQSKTGKMLYTGLRVVRSVFNTPLPENIRSDLEREKATVDLANMCLRRLTGGVDAEIGWMREQIFYLRMRATMPERLRYVITVPFRPTVSDCQVIRLPPRLFGLHYIVRPFRLLFKVSGKLFGSSRTHTERK